MGFNQGLQKSIIISKGMNDVCQEIIYDYDCSVSGFDLKVAHHPGVIPVVGRVNSVQQGKVWPNGVTSSMGHVPCRWFGG